MRKHIYEHIKSLARFLNENGVAGVVWSTNIHGEPIEIYTSEHYTSIQVGNKIAHLENFDEAFSAEERA